MKTQNEGIRMLDEFVCQAIPEPSAMTPTSLTVEIDWPGVNPNGFVAEFADTLPEEHRGRVTLSIQPAQRRPGSLAMDPAIIGAAVQGGPTVLGAFIHAWLTWPKLPKPNGVSVVLTVPDGTTFELQVDAAPEQIKQVVSAAGNAQKVRMKMKVRQ
jgi:hypothetical protein